MNKEVEILEKLVAFNTVGDKEKDDVFDYVSEYLKKFNFQIEKVGGVLIAKRGNNPQIGFLGHTDTVPAGDGWETNPFKLTQVEDKLFGLGSCDMKGGIAVFMAAASQSDVPMNLYFTYDEETDFAGIHELVESNEEFPPFMILAEPTDEMPIIGTKGFIEFRVDAEGKSAHASNPDDGHNAIYDAAEMIGELQSFAKEIRSELNESFDIPFTTLNIGKINGGDSANKVADKCSFMVDCRLHDEKQRAVIIDKISSLANQFNAKSVVTQGAPVFINNNDISNIENMTGHSKVTASFLTEASYIEASECVILGPRPGLSAAHKPNEFVSLRSMERMVQIYRKITEDKNRF